MMDGAGQACTSLGCTREKIPFTSTRREVDAAVTADGGAPLRDIIDDAAGGALVAAPYWEGVSVDGAHSSPHTGSHGSSWWGSQARRARRRG
jgi:hypothetical protein